MAAIRRRSYLLDEMTVMPSVFGYAVINKACLLKFICDSGQKVTAMS